MTYAQLTSLAAFAPALEDEQAAEQVEIRVKYEGYIARQQDEIENNYVTRIRCYLPRWIIVRFPVCRTKLSPS